MIVVRPASEAAAHRDASRPKVVVIPHLGAFGEVGEREIIERAGGEVLLRVVGETLGIVGFGNVGRRVARRVVGFDMTVLAHDPYVPDAELRVAGVRLATLAQVLQDSDFVCLLAPLSERTRGMIGAGELSLMQREAILVNTARGGLVDEPALLQALRTGQILGAALDVFEREPVDPDNPLLSLPNVVATPHMSSLSAAASVERRRRPALEVAAVLTGHRPRSVWNRAVLEKVSLT
jgi:phosphoglycerate dehydrogenase-like enzyme